MNVSAPETFDLGIGSDVRACLFDLDGVLTRTAVVQAAAWKKMFDAYLRARAEQAAEAFLPFDPVADYAKYIDGKPRYDGVRSFLQARAIILPEGDRADPPNAETVAGLGNRRTKSSSARSRRTVWSRTRAPSVLSKRRGARGYGAQSCHRAATPGR